MHEEQSCGYYPMFQKKGFLHNQPKWNDPAVGLESSFFDSCSKNKNNTASLLYYIYHITFRDGIFDFPVQSRTT